MLSSNVTISSSSAWPKTIMEPMRPDDNNETMIGWVVLTAVSVFVAALATTYVVSVHGLVALAIR